MEKSSPGQKDAAAIVNAVGSEKKSAHASYAIHRLWDERSNLSVAMGTLIGKEIASRKARKPDSCPNLIILHLQ